MSVRRRRFSPPTVPPNNSRSGRRQVDFRRLDGGVDPISPPLNLPGGVAADMENMEIDEGFIRPRSGLSEKMLVKDAFMSSGDEIHHIFTGTRADGNVRNLFISGRTAYIDSGVLQSVTALSGGVDLPIVDAQVTNDRWWSSAIGYDPDNDEDAWVFTSGADITGAPGPEVPPQHALLDSTSMATISDFISSGDSYAFNVASFDDRLVFFNTRDTSGNDRPTRVRWSARGDSLDFTSISAGFEDLVSMSGFGTGAAAQEDRLVLFSTEEIWFATPRRDDFAFDFQPLDQQVGCPFPRTIAETPVGLLFLGTDGQPYRLVGTQLRQFGDKIREYLYRNIENLRSRLIYGAYDPRTESYWLVYSPDDAEFDRAIQIYLDTFEQSGQQEDEVLWAPHSFDGFDLTAAHYVPSEGDYDGDSLLGGSGLLTFGSSDGSVYQLRSDQTTDSGTTFAARWRSPLIRSRDPDTFEAITEARADIEVASVVSRGASDAVSSDTATVEVYSSQDQGKSFTAEGSLSVGSTARWSTTFLPLTTPAARHQQIELRVLDGSRPSIGGVRLTLRSYTGRYSG